MKQAVNFSVYVTHYLLISCTAVVILPVHICFTGHSANVYWIRLMTDVFVSVDIINIKVRLKKMIFTFLLM